MAVRGKICIVSGGGRGLGRAMTLALASAGATVIAPTFIEEDLQTIEAEAEKIAGVASENIQAMLCDCLLYTSPSPRDLSTSRMPSSA